MKNLFVVAVIFARLAFAQTENGIVTGRILSSAGSPMSGIRVAAVEANDGNLGKNETPALLGLTQTDALGNYRLEIPPGRYYVMSGLVASPTYFPGAGSLESATAVTVSSGVTRDGVDFSLDSVFSVTGHVQFAANERTGTEVVLQFGSMPQPTTLRAAIGPDGAFRFPAVPRGDYTVRTGAIKTSLRVDRNITNFELKTPQTVEVTVRFSTDNGGPMPTASVNFVDVASTLPAVTAQDGSLIRLPGMEYTVTVKQLSKGYLVDTITYGSVDLRSESLDLSKSESAEVVVNFISPTPAVQVRGHVIGAIAAVPTKVRIFGSGMEADFKVDSNGKFTFPELLRGNYLTWIHADLNESFNLVGTRSNRSISVGLRSMDITNDVQDLVLTWPVIVAIVADPGKAPSAGWVAGGKIHAMNESNEPFFSFAPPATLYANSLGAKGYSRNAQIAAGKSTAEGEFRIDLPKDAQGEWVLSLGSPPVGYYVRKLSAGSIDLLRQPLHLGPDKPQNIDLQIEFAKIPRE